MRQRFELESFLREAEKVAAAGWGQVVAMTKMG